MFTPDNNDVVVFYYSGHGFSYEKDAAKRYPQVDLRTHPNSQSFLNKQQIPIPIT